MKMLTAWFDSLYIDGSEITSYRLRPLAPGGGVLNIYNVYKSDGCAEKVVHYLYSEVQVGDKFQFVFQKSDTDRFRLRFEDSEKNYILLFIDGSMSLRLNDRYGDYGTAETAPYPFSDFKEYKIVFEVLQLHWQIYVDDVAITSFVHRHPVKLIRKIIIQTGPAVTYLTKALDPRLTGQED